MAARDSSLWGLPPETPDDDTPPEVPLDVLIPSFERSAELAVTLAGLAAQLDTDFTLILADQSFDPVWETSAVSAMLRVLEAQGRRVRRLRNLPRRGLAHQRHVLLGHATAPAVLFLDADVWLEPGTLRRMLDALRESGAGFVGSAVQGLSYLDDVRPEEWENFEEWTGPVTPESPPKDGPRHERWQLHNAANLSHLVARTDLRNRGDVLYRVAWVGACVMYDREDLLASGGFEFWDQLPPAHAGEDVLAQWQVMQRSGGAGLLPSGAVHLEAPTTVTDRSTDAKDLID